MAKFFKDLFNTAKEAARTGAITGVLASFANDQIGATPYVNTNVSLYDDNSTIYDNFYSALLNKNVQKSQDIIAVDPNTEATQYKSNIFDSVEDYTNFYENNPDIVANDWWIQNYKDRESKILESTTLTDEQKNEQLEKNIQEKNQRLLELFEEQKSKRSKTIKIGKKTFTFNANGAQLTDKPIDTRLHNRLTFKLPHWGYDDMMTERDMFIKHLSSITDNPGYFYFKIFFDFNTQYGLFGGILNNENTMQSTNSAIKYLKYGAAYYKAEQISDRIKALEKFTKILSFINCKAPWYFNHIQGLNNANKFDTPPNERFIQIGCIPDAIDLRLSSLVELYKYAVYDEVNMKEIIPDNLRKFDMNVVLVSVPIKHYHTSLTNKRAYNKAKNIHPEGNTGADFSNVMSYKLFTFKNCEFDFSSMSDLYNTSVSNDNPFQTNQCEIKINYDRCYTHLMNEFMGFMIGSDGFLWDPKNEELEQNARYSALKEALSSDASIYKINSIIEDLIHYTVKDYAPVKYNNAPQSVSKMYSFSNGYMNDSEPSQYFFDKINWLIKKYTSAELLEAMGSNTLLKWLGSEYVVSKTSINGMKVNLYGDTYPGNPYFKEDGTEYFREKNDPRLKEPKTIDWANSKAPGSDYWREKYNKKEEKLGIYEYWYVPPGYEKQYKNRFVNKAPGSEYWKIKIWRTLLGNKEPGLKKLDRNNTGITGRNGQKINYTPNNNQQNTTIPGSTYWEEKTQDLISHKKPNERNEKNNTESTHKISDSIIMPNNNQQNATIPGSTYWEEKTQDLISHKKPNERKTTGSTGNSSSTTTTTTNSQSNNNNTNNNDTNRRRRFGS